MNHTIIKINNMTIGVIGAGFVGLSFTAVLAKNGYKVILMDSDSEKIEKIKSNQIPFYEPKLSSYLLKSSKQIETVTKLDQLIQNCSIIFITVGTPIGENGSINLSSVKQVAVEIGKKMRSVKNKPIIVLKSTVIPETSQKILKIIEKYSNKLSGKDFGFVTNPEFLREGKAIEDTCNPHIVVVGGNDKKDIKKIIKFYKKFYKQKISYFETNYVTAELIKYANNSFLATKISFINQLANICQSIPGVNIDDVAKAIGIDPRIGKMFLNAGPGYGGSCLPKDLQALISYSEKLGEVPVLLKAVQKTNDNQIKKIVELIKKKLIDLKNKKISILGLSFKENSDDIRESTSIKLVKILLKHHAKIYVHDPMALENTKKIFGNKIYYCKSIDDVILNSNCVVLMTPWKQYESIGEENFQTMKQKIVIDTRRLFINKKLKVQYHAIGINQDST
jgi:UDPglucose 6-dehydrogenase